MPVTITQEAIRSAHNRIRPYIRRTPVMTITGAAADHDTDITLKLECLQNAGSFKARGAFNGLLGVPGAHVPEAGVAAASGGNHGAAIAFAASTLAYRSNIFVPEISSPVKINLIRSCGGEIHVTGTHYAEALTASEIFIERTGAMAIHAYDQASTLQGQGTLGLELEQQAPDLDTVLVAVGGGGLIGGMAAWYRGRIKIVAVEPETSCALHAALSAGEPVQVEPRGVAADSLGASSVGAMMFPIARSWVDHVALVGDQAINEAQAWCWRNLRLAAEPGGATALAALRSGAYRPAPGERVGVVMCGGNVELAKLEALTSD